MVNSWNRLWNVFWKSLKIDDPSWRRKWHSHPEFLPGKSMKRGACCSLWGHRELTWLEHAHTHTCTQDTRQDTHTPSSILGEWAYLGALETDFMGFQSFFQPVYHHHHHPKAFFSIWLSLILCPHWSKSTIRTLFLSLEFSLLVTPEKWLLTS